MTKSLRLALGVSVVLWAAASCTREGSDPSRSCFSAEQMDQLVALDQASLADVSVGPTKLTTGAYVLETRYPGQQVGAYAVTLELDAQGRLVGPPQMPPGSLGTQGLAQNGSVVSWSQYDMDEGPTAKYVGLVDESMLWGRVYVHPGVGWREGEPPRIGFWKMLPSSSRPPSP